MFEIHWLAYRRQLIPLQYCIHSSLTIPWNIYRFADYIFKGCEDVHVSEIVNNNEDEFKRKSEIITKTTLPPHSTNHSGPLTTPLVTPSNSTVTLTQPTHTSRVWKASQEHGEVSHRVMESRNVRDTINPWLPNWCFRFSTHLIYGQFSPWNALRNFYAFHKNLWISFHIL